jgi:hypothetical protein
MPNKGAKLNFVSYALMRCQYTGEEYVVKGNFRHLLQFYIP